MGLIIDGNKDSVAALPLLLPTFFFQGGLNGVLLFGVLMLTLGKWFDVE